MTNHCEKKVPNKCPRRWRSLLLRLRQRSGRSINSRWVSQKERSLTNHHLLVPFFSPFSYVLGGWFENSNSSWDMDSTWFHTKNQQSHQQHFKTCTVAKLRIHCSAYEIWVPFVAKNGKHACSWMKYNITVPNDTDACLRIKRKKHCKNCFEHWQPLCCWNALRGYLAGPANPKEIKESQQKDPPNADCSFFNVYKSNSYELVTGSILSIWL